MIKYPPIPLLSDITSWKNIIIIKCGETLVRVDELCLDRIIVIPQYFLQGVEGAIKACYVRETVFKKLLESSELLPDKYKFVIWDAWRPIEVQRALFNRYKEMLNLQNPNFNEKELNHLAQKYVSLPSLDEKSPSPHITGGAIDLSIIDHSGNYLDMGTSYDDFNDMAHTRYFEEKIERGESLSSDELIILNNRRLLFHTLTKVGFANYSEEWWHYDYGNQFWAKSLKVDAIYGMIIVGDPE